VLLHDIVFIPTHHTHIYSNDNHKYFNSNVKTTSKNGERVGQVRRASHTNKS